MKEKKARKTKNAIKVPLYSKMNKCISCGVSVGSNAKGKTLKRIPAGFDKTFNLWLNYKILIDEKHHYFYSNCFENEE